MNVDTESCTRKEQKEVSFLNKHQTCQDVYDLPVQSRIEAAILGHTAPGTYFSLFQSCFVMFFFGGIVQFEANIEREREKTSSATCQHHSFNLPKF